MPQSHFKITNFHISVLNIGIKKNKKKKKQKQMGMNENSNVPIKRA